MAGHSRFFAHRVKMACSLLLAAGAVPLATASAQTDSTSGIQAPQQASADAALAESIKRGRAIYAYDRAAWVSTDALVARFGNNMPPIRGWIVEADGDRLVVHYYGLDGETPYILASIGTRGGRVIDRTFAQGSERQPLPAPSGRMLAALATATAALRAAELRPCNSSPFNTVVLPPDEANRISVYFLTPQISSATIPLGGHFRIDVAADGSAGEPRRFMSGCFDAQPGGSGDGRPTAMMLTHLLDPQPTEIHVFGSLSAGLPIYVMTTQNQKIWAVEGDRIRTMGEIGEGAGE